MRGLAYLLLLVVGTAVVFTVRADVRDCICNLDSPDIAQTKGCSLCVEAAKHPASERVIVLRDNDPEKPHRWLIVPREADYDGAVPLTKMNTPLRLELWNTAIAKGVEIWGDTWGVAMNGDIARRQCHAHIHVGKLLEEKENDNEDDGKGYYVDGPAQLPTIDNGDGLWFHPERKPGSKRLHVHVGEQITETVLVK